MIAGTIISNLNLREQVAAALLTLQGRQISLDQYLLAKGYRFTSAEVRQRFIQTLSYVSERMRQTVDELEEKRPHLRLVKG
ncbi:hypothetical protein D0544_06965 [Aestuariirhabdus litorea]|uniref:Uncharacterized protein n=1 Tax=Aestuariirhabdus litorea TaxID=2528527 RepID=A0A3P3VT11_9GAMM|nr:hypothetical protein D0544_06965 [Aestuariirhabdus litorea]